MKNYIILSLLSFFSISLVAQNYTLIIDTDTINIELNGAIKYKTKDGCQANIQLVEKPIQTFEDEYVKFKFSNQFSITKTDLGDGIEQLMVMTANGNGIIVQEYSDINPSFITNFMLAEMTKESINYGYTGEPTDCVFTLDSGKKLTGQKVTLTYGSNIEEYHVYGFGKKDRGIIIATLKNNLNEKEGDEVLDLFFETLEITMK